MSDTDVVFVKESIEELTQYLLEMKMKETIRLKRRQKLLRNLEVSRTQLLTYMYMYMHTYITSI